MNQETYDKSDIGFRTKEWWISKLNDILQDSEYEAIINPTASEKNVVVIRKGITKRHYIGIKPSANGKKYSLFTKQELYDKVAEQYEVPQPDRVKGKLPHFNQLEDPDFAFHLAMVLADDYGWTPLLSEYDPKITKEMWIDFFRNSGRFNDNYKHMMLVMLEIGGHASCVQLEERFGNTSDHYRATAVQMADKVHIYFDIPLYKDKTGKEQLWPILFTGRKTTKHERGNFIWKLRPELKEALIEFGLNKEGEPPMTIFPVSFDKNLILYGPPGTGKTYSTAIYAVAICDRKSIDELTDYAAVMARFNELRDEERIAFTTFHQSYGYEEFIEGIKPYTDDETKAISYSVEPGVFKLFCEKASEITDVDSQLETQENTKPFVFIIDEINRGNISKIFGELITLIEGTKRAGEPEAACAILPYSGETFSVPSNVYLLGTMNTADRSIALMDTALRRRFSFEELMPDADVLRKIGADKVDDLDVAEMLEKINERITFLYDREHTIGHAFFTRLKDEPTIAALSAIFKKSVLPLLQEYFYEDYQKIQLVLGDNAKTDDALKFVKDEKVNIRQIFKGNADELIDIEKRYTINDAAFDNIESYKQI